MSEPPRWYDRPPLALWIAYVVLAIAILVALDVLLPLRP